MVYKNYNLYSFKYCVVSTKKIHNKNATMKGKLQENGVGL